MSNETTMTPAMAFRAKLKELPGVRAVGKDDHGTVLVLVDLSSRELRMRELCDAAESCGMRVSNLSFNSEKIEFEER